MHSNHDYVMSTPNRVCKSQINKIFIKKNDYVKNRHKDKRIDTFTIQQNSIKDSSNPLLKTKNKQTKTFSLAKKWKAKKKNRTSDQSL